METIRKTGASIARIAVYLLAALVFLLPLIRLLLMGVTVENGYGLDNFAGLLSQERTRKAIVNTIIIAVSSTALAAGCGSGLAFLIAYCNIKRKGVIEFLVLLPFIIPSYIITLSWSSFFSSRGAFNGFLLLSDFRVWIFTPWEESFWYWDSVIFLLCMLMLFIC